MHTLILVTLIAGIITNLSISYREDVELLDRSIVSRSARVTYASLNEGEWDRVNDVWMFKYMDQMFPAGCDPSDRSVTTQEYERRETYNRKTHQAVQVNLRVVKGTRMSHLYQVLQWVLFHFEVERSDIQAEGGPWLRAPKYRFEVWIPLSDNNQVDEAEDPSIVFSIEAYKLTRPSRTAFNRNSRRQLRNLLYCFERPAVSHSERMLKIRNSQEDDNPS